MSEPGATVIEPCTTLAAARFVQSPQASKASAILGGQGSALERIMHTQKSTVAQVSPPVLQATLELAGRGAVFVTAGALVPGAGGIACDRAALPRGRGGPSGLGEDDFLLTRRLPVSHTGFDAEWSRVNRAALSPKAVQRLLPRHLRAAGLDRASIQGVNAWANARIDYAEDVKLFGRPDHWADAASTLRRRAGDCEDIAIAKMQVLAALGVPRADMYLTIARDLARHADHALLVVRLGGEHWVLDNAVDQLLNANESLDYQPVLSFSADRKWLHGATVALN